MSYYYIKSMQKRRENKISMIKNDNEEWIEDNNQIIILFIYFYQNLFTTNLEVSD